MECFSNKIAELFGSVKSVNSWEFKWEMISLKFIYLSISLNNELT